MTTLTRYQEWARYHVYHWEQVLNRAQANGDAELADRAQRKLNYWRKRVR